MCKTVNPANPSITRNFGCTKKEARSTRQVGHGNGFCCNLEGLLWSLIDVNKHKKTQKKHKKTQKTQKKHKKNTKKTQINTNKHK